MSDIEKHDLIIIGGGAAAFSAAFKVDFNITITVIY
jgi:thioredoxin reductase